MLDILNIIVKDKHYYDDLTLIKNLIMKINQMLNDDNINDEFLEEMDKDLNYLDQKYDDLFDLINLFDPIHFELKKKNHIKYVKRLREENRKKKQNREKNIYTEFMEKKARNTNSYFKGILENIEIILNNNFYATKDKINLIEVKSKIENWYIMYKENNTLKNIGAKDLENIGLEIADFFDKYITKEPVKENYAERLLYDFGHLEDNWKQEMLGGNKNER